MLSDINDITRASLLYDFYGALLTEKQRSVMALYHEENLSLSEIADEYGISRQAVHDALKKAEQALEDYETIKTIDKLKKTANAAESLKRELKLLEESADIGGQAKIHLRNIKDIVAGLED